MSCLDRGGLVSLKLSQKMLEQVLIVVDVAEVFPKNWLVIEGLLGSGLPHVIAIGDFHQLLELSIVVPGVGEWLRHLVVHVGGGLVDLLGERGEGLPKARVVDLRGVILAIADRDVRGMTGFRGRVEGVIGGQGLLQVFVIFEVCLTGSPPPVSLARAKLVPLICDHYF